MKTTIYEEHEFAAVSSNRSIAASLRSSFPELGRDEFASLRYLPSPIDDRVWKLGRLVVPYGDANPVWQADAPVSIYTNDMQDAEARRAIAALALPADERIVVGLDQPSVTLELRYGRLLELLPLGAWIASAMDASWMLYWHHGEFAVLVRPRFDGVKAIEFSESFRTCRGEVVPKAQYRIIRADAGEWWSGALRDDKSREAMRGFVELLARLSGARIRLVDCFDEQSKR